MADPKEGTGKKPKGSGRRLYTDENPKDTVKIKYATTADARATCTKVKRSGKSFARQIQILTVMEQRSRFGKKPEQAKIAKQCKISIRKSHGKKRPEWKDSKYADAKGKFKELSCGDLANWLIKSRKGNKKAIVGSLNQQIVFNRKKNPSYAKKMKCARNAAMKKLGDGKKN